MTRRHGRLAVVTVAGPVLVIGLMTSGIANRLDFVVWTMVAVPAYVVLLLMADHHDWSTTVWMGAAAWLLAAAFAAYALLVQTHVDALDLGARAFLPAGVPPLLTQPAFGYGVAVGLGLIGVLMFLLSAPLKGRRLRARAHAAPTSNVTESNSAEHEPNQR